MNYKRIEIYLGWTCNKKCIFCSEYNVMEKNWNKKISPESILKKLIKYKKEGYNHVTFLGGEPFIQSNFLQALKIAKKLGYTVLVTTNATMLEFEKQAEKYLKYIDELILSINTLERKNYKLLHNIGKLPSYDKVFSNISKYWNGSFLKVNIVLNKVNLDDILDIIEFIADNKVGEFSITYPDLYGNYYSLEDKKNNILIKYSALINYVDKYYKKSIEKKVKMKIADIPFCILKNKKYINISDDNNYSNRIKISSDEIILDREKYKPRNREIIPKCNGCIYEKKCWGPGVEYIKNFGNSEISKIN